MRRCLLAIGVAMLASSALAQQKDAANCADHPLLTRLPDYWISSCKHTQFDAYKFNVGKTTKPVEGEFWEIRYQGRGLGRPHREIHPHHRAEGGDGAATRRER
jgi:hypothetical protein